MKTNAKGHFHICISLLSTLELNIKNKLRITAAFCKSPSQSRSEFTNFITCLELTLQTIASKYPFLSLVLSNFNTKNKVWFEQENTTTERNVIHDLMTQYVLTQIIHEPIHLLDCSSSCNDIIFTSQDKLITKSGAH